MDLILSFLLVAMDEYTLVFANDAFFVRRTSGKKFLLGTVGCVLFNYLFVNFTNLPYPLHFISMSLIIWIQGCFLYRGFVIMKLMVSIICNVLLFCFDGTAIFLIAQITGTSFSSIVSDPLITLIAAPISKLLVLCCMRLVKVIRHPSSTTIRWKNLFLLCLFPCTSAFFLTALLEIASQTSWLLIVGTSLLLVSNLALFIILDSLEADAQEHEENTLLKQQMQLEMESIQALRETYDSQRAAAHDYNKHLTTLYELLHNGDSTSAVRYLAQLQKSNITRFFAVKTESPILDALLNQKYTLAKSSGIDIDLLVNDLSSVKICPEHLVVLIANLLDNAIEACQRLDGERKIQMTLVLEKDELFFSVLNTSKEVKITGKTIATSKKDELHHGIGLRNVQRILSLYHSSLELEYQNGWFHAVCLVPNILIA